MRGCGRELPPRTRRIRQETITAGAHLGTTSAHAENTILWHRWTAIQRNYLRARGEYCLSTVCRYFLGELPPRTRRIRASAANADKYFGTTSAHAENTTGAQSMTHTMGNYLRARGEYSGSRIHSLFSVELPPRTRRIRIEPLAASMLSGTTSAHAENTTENKNSTQHARNYLRARGEYVSTPRAGLTWSELPPRTRRIHVVHVALDTSHGTTSAHAENT